jgi:hypothetical protein
MTRPRIGPRLPPCALTALALLTGCSREVKAPPISPEAAGKQAVAQYDRNGDGLLDAQELAHCPALKGSLKEMDKDGDGKLAAQEISDRLTAYKNSNVARMSLSCEVTYRGEPLEGATVRLVPESFLGDAIKPITGTSDGGGFVDLKEEGASVPGVACGFYRVEVTRKDGSGKELVPKRYNAETILGQEVSPMMRGGLTIKLN